MRLNPNKLIVARVEKALEAQQARFGKQYCPCLVVKNDDTVCPCKDMRIHSKCHCGLYVE